MKTNEKWSIVFLDAATLGPGMNFDKFTSERNCEFFDLTSPDQIAGRISGHNVAVTNKVVFDKTVLSLPEAADLKVIAVAATGYNNVDLAAAAEHGISVCNVAGYSSMSVAQQTFCLLLELTNHAGGYFNDVLAGEWSRSNSFTMLSRPVVELAGKTMGIIGFGAIGRSVGKVAEAFGMEVIVSSPELAPEEQVPLDELFRRSDVISVHCPLMPETSNIINERAISLMKPSVFIINAARGGIVDESALIDALRSNRIAGAGFDVLSTEPPPLSHPMLVAARERKNLIITPHVAWSAIEARQRLLDEVAANIDAFERGESRNKVN